MTDTTKIVTMIVQELLNGMQVSATVSISQIDGVLKINLESDDTGVLIGYRGHTLNALQIIVGQMLFKQTGEWTRIMIDVGDYRARRDEQLMQQAQEVAQQVAATGQDEPMYDLTPYERHIIHSALSDHPDVLSESEGEGRDRRLIIKKRS